MCNYPQTGDWRLGTGHTIVLITGLDSPSRGSGMSKNVISRSEMTPQIEILFVRSWSPHILLSSADYKMQNIDLDKEKK